MPLRSVVTKKATINLVCVVAYAVGKSSHINLIIKVTT